MIRPLASALLLSTLLIPALQPRAVHADDALPWQAGLASVDITPRESVVLLGYPDRSGTSKGVATKIYAKALALADRSGKRRVLITADLVGFHGPVIGEFVPEQLQKKAGLERAAILLNASHSHTGPVASLAPDLIYNVSYPSITKEEAERTVRYTRELREKLVRVGLEALDRMQPARLSWGTGEVSFVMSRRMPAKGGLVVMSANPKATADRSVPVLRIDGPGGKLRAVVFGAACHAVAAGGLNEVCGDFPGFAQTFLEEQYPGAQAMYMAGCGADANPQPLGTLDLAKSHGRALGREVHRVLKSDLKVVRGPLRASFKQVELPLQSLSKDELRPYLPLPNMQARTAKQMLNVLQSGGAPDKTFLAPFAVWRFDDDLTLVALPSEPVSEYVGLVKGALGREKTWVAGYNNDFFGYLPTRRVIAEGGHEAIGITQWSMSPSLATRVGFFAPSVEQQVIDTVQELAAEAGWQK